MPRLEKRALFSVTLTTIQDESINQQWEVGIKCVFIFARSVDEPVTKFKVERLQVEKNWEKKPEQCQQKVLIGSFHIIRPHFSISHTNRILYRKLEATMKVSYVQSTPDN